MSSTKWIFLSLGVLLFVASFSPFVLSADPNLDPVVDNGLAAAPPPPGAPNSNVSFVGKMYKNPDPELVASLVSQAKAAFGVDQEMDKKIAKLFSTNLPMANIQELEAERIRDYEERAKAVEKAGLVNEKSAKKEVEQDAGKQKEQQVTDPWLDDVNVELEPSTPEPARPRRREMIQMADENEATTAVAKVESRSPNWSLRIHFWFRFETLAQRRARLCSDSMSHLVPEMLEKSPPFAIYNLSCQYEGKGAEAENKEEYQMEMEEAQLVQWHTFWETLWTQEMIPCHIGLAQLVKMVPNCLLLAGFVDHLFPTGAPAGTLIAELDGPKLDGQAAVVRLLCAANALKFQETLQSYGGFKSIQKLPSEEMFLKTVFALEFSWFPGCIVVFFDARTLDPQRHQMGRLLLQQGPALKRGTKYGANPWAASKFICGQRATNAFRTELKWMRFRNRDVPTELGKWEDQVREQLTQKINEEMFPVVQVTAPPARGFFRRLFDGLG